MTWVQCVKRVFNIDESIYPNCVGEARVIASIEERSVNEKILNH